jgi:hypothetical protein
VGTAGRLLNYLRLFVTGSYFEKISPADAQFVNDAMQQPRGMFAMRLYGNCGRSAII